VFDRAEGERASPAGGGHRVHLALDGDLADFGPARGHRIFVGPVVDVFRATADVPKGLEPALAVDELDVLGLRTLEQVSDPAPERAGPTIHRALLDIRRGEPVRE
jgi:hypothetical protein